ncbi:hypothetical protein GCM10009560_29800 [Nonomuraea longicatena]|uniref:Uncharacterized protein n=1 Tax=Nonomuraea longicatena TaxID=83682 RepID=A0ABP3ZXZ2_9ACTN
MVNGAPVPDEPVGVAVEDGPSGEDAIGPRDEKPTPLRVESVENLVRDGGDVLAADRRKGEPGGAARVGDGDPAVDQLLPEPGRDVVQAGDLDEVGGAVARHGRDRVRPL